MFKRLRELRKEELVKGSLVLFVMINIFNVLNYLFQFFMARLLGPGDYGTLAALMSLIYIFSIPTESIQTIITKYTTKLKINNENNKINFLIKKSTRKALRVSFIFFILFLPIGFFLSYFLDINFYLLILTSFLIFYSFLIPICRGALQGMKKFADLGLNMVLEGFFKVLFSIILVIGGLKVYGAIGGMIIGAVIALILILLNLRKTLGYKEEKTAFPGIYGYSLPIFVSIISIVLIYSLDMLLAKRFFSPEIAGNYAVISMLGKIILFGTFSIGKTMFPLSSEKYERGEKSSQLLKKSIMIMFVCSSLVLLIYLLFPKLIITLLFGPDYIGSANILFIIGLTYTFISFSNLIILYRLSLNRIKKSSLMLPVFVILQIILLSIFHSTLIEFSIAFLIVSFLMFLYNLLVIKKSKKQYVTTP